MILERRINLIESPSEINITEDIESSNHVEVPVLDSFDDFDQSRNVRTTSNPLDTVEESSAIRDCSRQTDLFSSNSINGDQIASSPLEALSESWNQDSVVNSDVQELIPQSSSNQDTLESEEMSSNNNEARGMNRTINERFPWIYFLLQSSNILNRPTGNLSLVQPKRGTAGFKNQLTTIFN